MKRQQLLVATRMPRRRQCPIHQAPIGSSVRITRTPGDFGKLACVNSYVRWTKIEEEHLFSLLPRYWGNWKRLLESGRDKFHPTRDRRQIMEKVRRMFGSLKPPSSERMQEHE